MTTLSIFDAAREAPERIAFIDDGNAVSFRQAAERTAPLAAALLATLPTTLALTPRADTESMLWLYAALATGTPLLTLHARATPSDRHDAMTRARASVAPAPVSGPFDEHALPPVADSVTLAYIPTSGSTGTPRLVELSRAAILASALASAENMGWESDDRWLLCLPLAHTGGLSIATRCLLARRSVLLFEPGPNGVLARIAELKRTAADATLMSLVPSVLAALLDAGFEPPTGLRAVLVGGAGCSPALAERAHAARIPLLTSYGLTETASQVVTRRYAERFEPLAVRQGVVSSGHPLLRVELRITAGALAIRAPSMFSGYLGETSRLDPDGFLLTNDQAELGADGELYVRGRLDDVIVSGGENVDPLEVEAALCSLPGVKAACVFGTASSRFGQVVTAVLVTSDARLGEPSHLAQLLADRLARHKLPRLALIAESLPLTTSGKVDRRVIREQFSASLAGASRS